MKKLFIPSKAKSNVNIKAVSKLSKELPKNLAITYSIQFEDAAKKIRKVLSKKHNITLFSQVLGCSRPKLSKKTQAILLISSGEFHAVSLALSSNIPVYVLHKNNLKKITKNQVDKLKKSKKASKLKFLHSNKVGIITSTKPGQLRLKKAIKLNKKLSKKSKKDSYIFLSNNININEFQNFSGVDSWINTACPRLDMDSSIINMNQLKKEKLVK